MLGRVKCQCRPLNEHAHILGHRPDSLLLNLFSLYDNRWLEKTRRSKKPSISYLGLDRCRWRAVDEDPTTLTSLPLSLSQCERRRAGGAGQYTSCDPRKWSFLMEGERANGGLPSLWPSEGPGPYALSAVGLGDASQIAIPPRLSLSSSQSQGN